jgi:hypothetical protein
MRYAIESGADIEILDDDKGQTPLSLSNAETRMEVLPPRSWGRD